MTTIYIIMAVMTFVVPAVCILGDNGNWERRK